jgi:hypothetical protein
VTAASPGAPATRQGPLRLLGVFYAAMAGIALYGLSGGLMLWLHAPRLLALPVAVGIELLAAVLFAFADWRRTDKAEKAIAARLLSVVVALGVAGMNWAGHLDQPGPRVLFVGSSLAGYCVWVLHTNARRRDKLRDIGKLSPTGPDYPLAQWMTHPWITRRARTLALKDESLGLYGSLAAAQEQIRTERRQKAIAALLRRKLAGGKDRLAAQIATTTYDLDDLARRLADAADYEGLAVLLGRDLNPARLAARTPGEAEKADRAAARVGNGLAVVGSNGHATNGRAAAASSRPSQTTIRATVATNHTSSPADHSDLAVRDAATIRARFPQGVPDRGAQRLVRTELGWHAAKATNAVRAYRANADLARPAGGSGGTDA